MARCPYTRGVDSVGSVVLIAVTVAVGLAFVTGVVQLWRHQPVHHDQVVTDPADHATVDEETVELTPLRADAPDDADDEDDADGELDEETVALPREDGEPDEDDGSAEDEPTVDLRGADRPAGD